MVVAPADARGAVVQCVHGTEVVRTAGHRRPAREPGGLHPTGTNLAHDLPDRGRVGPSRWCRRRDEWAVVSR